MSELHIYLKGIYGTRWMAGTLYIQNLGRAIASLPLEERKDIRLSVGVPLLNSTVTGAIPSYADRVYTERFFNFAYFEFCKMLAEHITWLPSALVNPRKLDFVYPELAGKWAPYRWAGWIPDFQYRYLPDFFSQKEIDTFLRVHGKIAQFAPLVVLSSKTVQADFQRFYPGAARRSTVMNFVSAIEPEWYSSDPKVTQKKYGLPDDFFLLSNQFWKHKDHAVVIEALGTLKQFGIHPAVVCTGSLPAPRHSQHLYYRQLLARIGELGLDPHIRILGFIPRFDQIQLMRRCLAVIQPSLFEGWSTVVEDARALGKPMLISDFPVHLEQNPPDSRFFERGNREQLASLIQESLLKLKPGPDLEKENFARQKNAERMVAFGRRFLEIVRCVMSRETEGSSDASLKRG